MTRLFLILIFPSMLFGSGGCAKDPYDRADVTPAGWHVTWTDAGTVTSGLHTKDQIYDLFDAAMVRAAGQVETIYGIPSVHVLNRARNGKRVHDLRDGFAFLVVGSPSDFPNAVYASGEIMSGKMILAFWSLDPGAATDPSLIPSSAPLWTVLRSPSTGLYRWGLEVEGDQFPALWYELGHQWGY